MTRERPSDGIASYDLAIASSREMLDLIRSLMSYDPVTGVFTWLVTRNKIHAGCRAGSISKRGYRHITICGKIYKGHRLAWLLTYGILPAEVDHINGNKSDDRISNLRAATRTQNARNRKVRSNTYAGLKGVSVDGHQYRASIMVDRKVINLGRYTTAEEAHAAYARASVKYHGEFGRAT